MRGQGLNDLPRCELERRSSHHKGIFFEVPLIRLFRRGAEGSGHERAPRERPPRQPYMFGQEGRQFELMQMMREQNLGRRRAGGKSRGRHAALPEMRAI
jgi:hypothetical protein